MKSRRCCQTKILQKEWYTSSITHRHAFHVLHSMNCDIIVKKMKIILEQKNIALEITQKLAYSSNIEEYNENLVALEEANI